jgi:alpha-ketoglutarate-dependent taurine dioxygenase|tara:strand:- start:1391 stop:2218 length:828 start_codon:yes stop_codon:yes gene_type:complete
LTTQILNFSDEQLNELVKEIVSTGHVILHDQHGMTQQQYVEVCNRIGNCEYYNYFMNPKDHPEISLVSGQKDDEGKAIGVFGNTELQWHANGTARHKFKEICVTLYCIVECIDTVLSICNQCDAFAELSEKDKERFRTIDIQLDNKPDAIYKNTDEDGHDLPEKTINTGKEFYQEDVDRRPLVGKHPNDGREYLYFMVPYIVGAFENGERINHEALYEELWEKLFKSKYMVHHVFREGDLLFMDQLHTIHRRSPVKNLDRMLWRCAFDYSNIDFT